MSMTNEPAFPHPRDPQPGMSLRDWFAGQAMVGLLSYHGDWSSTQKVSSAAYSYADAMLKERDK